MGYVVQQDLDTIHSPLTDESNSQDILCPLGLVHASQRLLLLCVAMSLGVAMGF